MNNYLNLMDDMHLSSQDTFLDFYNTMQSGNVEKAQEILNKNPDVLNQIMNSENINYLINLVNEREIEPKNDIDVFLDNLYSLFLELIKDTTYIGEYSTTTQYYSHNMVKYNDLYYFAKTKPPIGTEPTDITYWEGYNIKGLQGYGGISDFQYKSSWNSTVNYKTNDVVIYKNKMWYAVADNINSAPNLNHYPWNLIMAPAVANKTPIQKEMPLYGYNEGDFWFEITEGEDVERTAWEQMASEPTPKTAATSFLIGNNIYIVAGQDGALAATNETEVYDTSTNTWSTKANYPIKCDGAIGFSLGNKGYVVGGLDSTLSPIGVYKDVYSYAPDTNTWTKKNDFPVPIVNVNGGTVLDNKAYVMEGVQTPNALRRIYVYNEENDNWEIETTEPYISVSPILKGVNGKIYMIGGDDGADSILDSTYIYDLNTKTWSTGRNITTPRAYAGSFVKEEDIYVVGGLNELSYSTNVVERYNINDNKWYVVSPMKNSRNSLCSEYTDTYGYALGGIDLILPMVGGFVERFKF